MKAHWVGVHATWRTQDGKALAPPLSQLCPAAVRVLERDHGFVCVDRASLQPPAVFLARGRKGADLPWYTGAPAAAAVKKKQQQQKQKHNVGEERKEEKDEGCLRCCPAPGALLLPPVFPLVRQLPHAVTDRVDDKARLVETLAAAGRVHLMPPSLLAPLSPVPATAADDALLVEGGGGGGGRGRGFDGWFLKHRRGAQGKSVRYFSNACALMAGWAAKADSSGGGGGGGDKNGGMQHLDRIAKSTDAKQATQQQQLLTSDWMAQAGVHGALRSDGRRVTMRLHALVVVDLVDAADIATAQRGGGGGEALVEAAKAAMAAGAPMQAHRGTAVGVSRVSRASGAAPSRHMRWRLRVFAHRRVLCIPHAQPLPATSEVGACAESPAREEDLLRGGGGGTAASAASAASASGHHSPAAYVSQRGRGHPPIFELDEASPANQALRNKCFQVAAGTLGDALAPHCCPPREVLEEEKEEEEEEEEEDPPPESSVPSSGSASTSFPTSSASSSSSSSSSSAPASSFLSTSASLSFAEAALGAVAGAASNPPRRRQQQQQRFVHLFGLDLMEHHERSGASGSLKRYAANAPGDGGSDDYGSGDGDDGDDNGDGGGGGNSASGEPLLLEVNAFPALGWGSMAGAPVGLFDELSLDVLNLAVLPALSALSAMSDTNPEAEEGGGEESMNTTTQEPLGKFTLVHCAVI